MSEDEIQRFTHENMATHNRTTELKDIPYPLTYQECLWDIKNICVESLSDPLTHEFYGEYQESEYCLGGER